MKLYYQKPVSHTYGKDDLLIYCFSLDTHLKDTSTQNCVAAQFFCITEVCYKMP